MEKNTEGKSWSEREKNVPIFWVPQNIGSSASSIYLSECVCVCIQLNVSECESSHGNNMSYSMSSSTHFTVTVACATIVKVPDRQLICEAKIVAEFLASFPTELLLTPHYQFIFDSCVFGLHSFFYLLHPQRCSHYFITVMDKKASY